MESLLTLSRNRVVQLLVKVVLQLPKMESKHSSVTAIQICVIAHFHPKFITQLLWERWVFYSAFIEMSQSVTL